VLGTIKVVMMDVLWCRKLSGLSSLGSWTNAIDEVGTDWNGSRMCTVLYSLYAAQLNTRYTRTPTRLICRLWILYLFYAETAFPEKSLYGESDTRVPKRVYPISLRLYLLKSSIVPA